MRKRALFAAVAALLLLTALPALAGEEEGGKMEEASIQGCLAAGEEEGWYLLTTKGEDGKEITVHGPDSFADHVGHEVKVTGEWHEEDGEKKFHGEGLEHISTDC